MLKFPINFYPYQHPPERLLNITDKLEKMITKFNLATTHPSWHRCLENAINQLDETYRDSLYQTNNWLPGCDKIFNAFSLPVENVNYVLFGESPYPRTESANGYAFWDANVKEIWSETGLSKSVNRATSLRNIIKMLLVADEILQSNKTSQEDIAQINKDFFVKNNSDFFQNLLSHGFLLLNASLVLQPTSVRKDAREWRPFLEYVLNFLLHERPTVQLILLGNIANEIDPLIHQQGLKKIYAEHPYNISFIHNKDVIEFFKPLRLLKAQVGK